MKYIDNFLNKITMYRLVLYGLSVLVFISIVMRFLGYLFFSPVGILLTLAVMCISCYLSNRLIAFLLNAQINVESAWITALLLTLIVWPIKSLSDVGVYMLIAFVAMASKYFLAINKKHLFNPVAIALVLAGLVGNGSGVWWVGNSMMIFPVAILGFLILRKTKRFEMFGAFLATAILSIISVSLYEGLPLLDTIYSAILSGPLIFFATVMLTEPLTTPPYRLTQIIYGLLVGVVYGLDFNIGSIYNTPELALVIGNIFAYFVSPKERLKLKLIEKKNLTSDTYEFTWLPDRKFSFMPGQYLEWTLGHSTPDTRGNRRYYTISSSPTEEKIKIGIKTYPDPSTFKQKLVSLSPGDSIFASQLAGEFTLPSDESKKMVWIAGGIGVTPFRSMAKYILDKNENRDIIFFYSNKTSKDIVYNDIFNLVEKNGVKTHYVCNTKTPDDSMLDMKYGYVDEVMLKAHVPDYKDRIFYISGPHGMVTSFESTLSKLGIPSSQIKVDFFPGFA
ncbi:MAG: RnfABCDGE type electron transport complex subunit D [Minisyncoccia bacterium]